MGASSSKMKNSENNEMNNKNTLKQQVDLFATNLILESNNEDLKKLLKVTYCNMVAGEIETILNKNYTKMQIEIINGIITNKKETVSSYIKLNTDDIASSIKQIEENHITKKELCKEIALFYTKISHLYAAIYRVIGEKSICAIKKKINKIETKNNNFTEGNLIFANSKYCKKNQIYKTKFLYDEIGIPELEELYKDEFDEDKKKFVMSDEQKTEYQNDVDTFYKSYTGNENNGQIKSFQDIPIFNYKISKLCDNSNHRNSNKTYVGFSNNNNLKKYANFLADIMNSTNHSQQQLIEILEKDIFVKINNKYIINNELTKQKLNLTIKKTRNIIVAMFIECEEKYQKAVNIFKTIVFDKNISISEKRAKNVTRTTSLFSNKDDLDIDK